MRKLFILLLGCFPLAAYSQITFRDVTAQAGIHFTHNNGAFGKRYLPETMGPGCAFIDYDNDGWPDILLINGENWPGHPGPVTTPKLYHNNHNGTFTDVTAKAGLDSGARTSFQLAPRGSIMIATASSTWSSQITCSGR